MTLKKAITKCLFYFINNKRRQNRKNKMNKEITKKITLKDGREITISTGKLTRQARSVEIRMGKTHICATVVSSKETRDGVDFLPLTVDYREKFTDGRFPGGFLKEAKTNRSRNIGNEVIDRILRPMFPGDYHAEVQIMISLNSHDPEVSPDSLALTQQLQLRSYLRHSI